MENIITLSKSVRRTREGAKNFKICMSGLQTEANEEDCTTADTKSIILLLRAFHLYTQIFDCLATLSSKLQLQLAVGLYAQHLMML